jgi:4-hydroxybenzoate polyprenyltransferase
VKSLLRGLRTLLILGRVSNLPTVWSNLFVGWALGEGDPGAFASLGLLLTGGSFLYVGGMYLNDFCDASFDAQYCPERPIPAGKISHATVGRLALLWFLLGIVCLGSFGLASAITALFLIAAIVLYDFHHKGVFWAPWIMGLCRALLYVAGMGAARGLEVFSGARLLWPQYLFALTLGLYVVGITLFARGESRSEKPARATLLLLFLPVLVQAVLGVFFPSHLPLSTVWAMPEEYLLQWTPFYCLVFIGWLAWLLVPYWLKLKASLRRLVSGLLAGIVLVDMIVLSQLPETQAPLVLPFFLLALVLQRFIPAT